MVSDNPHQKLLDKGWDLIETIGSSGFVRIEKWRARNTDFCVKTGSGRGQAMLQYEAAGLELLGRVDGVRAPGIEYAENGILVTEWVNRKNPVQSDWASLGRMLSALHDTENPRFGLDQNGFCGNGEQLNRWQDDGLEFFVRCRLEPQIKLARNKGYLSATDCSRMERLIEKLDVLIPEQPAVLIHGDLWQGNVIFDAFGPCLIDPAAYYGWAEADLAMTTLFGRFDEVFYEAYMEGQKVIPGIEERFEIYNCYHLLNHLNIFGTSYHAFLMGTINRYVDHE